MFGGNPGAPTDKHPSEAYGLKPNTGDKDRGVSGPGPGGASDGAGRHGGNDPQKDRKDHDKDAPQGGPRQGGHRDKDAPQGGDRHGRDRQGGDPEGSQKRYSPDRKEGRGGDHSHRRHDHSGDSDSDSDSDHHKHGHGHGHGRGGGGGYGRGRGRGRGGHC